MSQSKICYIATLPAQPFFRAVSPRGKQWQVGQTINIAFIGGTRNQRDLVERYGSDWLNNEDHPVNLKFNFNSSLEESDVRISFKKGIGSWSYLGTDALFIDSPKPTMNFGWLDAGTIRHEFGHMLSLAHEHQHPDKEIDWDRSAVIKDASGPPNHWSLHKIEHNILRSLKRNTVRYTNYDKDSVMLYFFPPSWDKNGRGSKANSKISELDYALVYEMYPQIKR